MRDYLAPLARLTKPAGFSESGRLSLGLPALRIYPAQEHVVPIGRGRFEVQARSEATDSHRSLGWSVVSRLERITRRGRVEEIAKVKRQYVATVGEFGKQDFGFGGRVVPGFYRLSVEIRSFDRKALGRYAELFRAVPPRSDERLVASFSTLSPGQTGYLRVDNFGTMPAVYGLGYRIFNRDGEEVPLEGIVFSDILLRLQAGYSGHCFPFKAPAKVSAGDYLILVEAGDSLRGLGPVTATVTID